MGFTQKQTAFALGFKHRSSVAQLELGYAKVTDRVANLCTALERLNKPKGEDNE